MPRGAGRASLRTARRRATACRQSRQRKGDEQSAHTSTLDLCAVVRPVRQQAQRRQQGCHDEDREDRKIDQASFGHGGHLLSRAGLEADVLQSVGRLAIEPGGGPIVAAPRSEIALGDPRRRAMTS
jgi:hypothetical protein